MAEQPESELSYAKHRFVISAADVGMPRELAFSGGLWFDVSSVPGIGKLQAVFFILKQREFVFGKLTLV